MCWFSSWCNQFQMPIQIAAYLLRTHRSPLFSCGICFPSLHYGAESFSVLHFRKTLVAVTGWEESHINFHCDTRWWGRTPSPLPSRTIVFVHRCQPASPSPGAVMADWQQNRVWETLQPNINQSLILNWLANSIHTFVMLRKRTVKLVASVVFLLTS